MLTTLIFLTLFCILRLVRGKENRKERQVHNLGKENGKEGEDLSLICALFYNSSIQFLFYLLPNNHNPEILLLICSTIPALYFSLRPNKLQRSHHACKSLFESHPGAFWEMPSVTNSLPVPTLIRGSDSPSFAWNDGNAVSVTFF